MIKIAKYKAEKKTLKYLLNPQCNQGKEPLTSEARKTGAIFGGTCIRRSHFSVC